MGTIVDAFATAFRDYVTEGVPASGEYEPDKALLRGIGSLIESALAAGVLGGVSVAYATRAELNANLAFPAGATALVYADATDANNDLYVKTGASGAGAWTLSSVLHNALNLLGAPYVALAKEWADNAPDVEVTGNPGKFSARHYAEKTALQLLYVKEKVGAQAANSAGIDEGVYNAETDLLYPMVFETLKLQVTSGTGSVEQVTVFIDDWPVFGPVEATGASIDHAVSLHAGEHSTVRVQFFGVVGDVKAVRAMLIGSVAL